MADWDEVERVQGREASTFQVRTSPVPFSPVHPEGSQDLQPGPGSQGASIGTSEADPGAVEETLKRRSVRRAEAASASLGSEKRLSRFPWVGIPEDSPIYRQESRDKNERAWPEARFFLMRYF